MVLKGQFLERPTLVPVEEGLVLEGLSHRGEKRPPALILPPRPDEGGSMDHVVAAELAWATARAGFPSLRFNFRGVGASQGGLGDAVSRLKDAEAALRVLSENANTGAVALVALAGSASAALELVELHPGVGGLALVSPREVEADSLLRLSIPLLIVMGAEERNPHRAALSAAVSESGGRFELIEAADHTFKRNLPQVGRAVAGWLSTLSGEGG